MLKEPPLELLSTIDAAFENKASIKESRIDNLLPNGLARLELRISTGEGSPRPVIVITTQHGARTKVCPSVGALTDFLDTMIELAPVDTRKQLSRLKTVVTNRKIRLLRESRVAYSLEELLNKCSQTHF